MTTSSPRARARLGAALMLAAALAGGAPPAKAWVCSVTVTNHLAFGAYHPSAALTDTGTATVSCLGLVLLERIGYTLSLGTSSHGPGDRISTRYLNNTTNGGDYMAYNVYTDASHTTVWGNGSTGALISGAPITALITLRSHDFYGRVPAGQYTLLTGVYSESLTVTVSYDLL